MADVRIFLYGYPSPEIVSDREMSSSIRDWQETADFVFFAAFVAETDERKVLMPPSFEIDSC